MQLVIVDTTQIQRYIFNSNRLRENIGASHLVVQATRDWALESLVKPHNVIRWTDVDISYHDQKTIERDGLASELVYTGGGNFVALFREEENARIFIRELSRRVLCQAPGLELLIIRHEFCWEGSFADAMKVAFKKLSQEKQTRSRSAQMVGLGVTALCGSTGFPAKGKTPKIGNDEGSVKLASAEILAKHEAIEKAKARMKCYLNPGDQYDYALSVDDLGRTIGEHSFIGVIHADGDGIGQKFVELRVRYRSAAQNREYIQALRDLARTVEAIAHRALQKLLEGLIGSVKEDAIRQEIDGTHSIDLILEKKDGKSILPFRPLVFGGDDVTFLCDGRLALSLATLFLQAFESASEEILEEKLTACAGIAIVKVHHPFAQAYQLASQLCDSAKGYRAKKSLKLSCLDWHFAVSGHLGNGIKDIRKQEFSCNEGSLTLRPVTLGENSKEKRHSWIVIKRGLEAFQTPEWFTKRNKVKVLRETLREGAKAVQQFRALYHIEKLPDLGVGSEYPETGWHGKKCGYFDAIELIDSYISLRSSSEEML